DGSMGLAGMREDSQLLPLYSGEETTLEGNDGTTATGRKRKREPFTLPEGWSEMYRVRQDGSTKGRRDIYFVSPDKKVFRSRSSALRYMRGEPPSGAVPVSQSARKYEERQPVGASPATE